MDHKNGHDFANDMAAANVAKGADKLPKVIFHFVLSSQTPADA